VIAATVGAPPLSTQKKYQGNSPALPWSDPSGVIAVYGDVRRTDDGQWSVHEVHFTRTARRQMEGFAYVRKRLVELP